jgi:hypothetical protein
MSHRSQHKHILGSILSDNLDGVKFSNREQLSAQTPSPDDPTLDLYGVGSSDGDNSILVALFLIFDPSNVTQKPTQAHPWINPE